MNPKAKKFTILKDIYHPLIQAPEVEDKECISHDPCISVIIDVVHH